MATFGQLIEPDIPVVLFFTTWYMNNEADTLHYFMKELASIYQDKINVIVIEAEKNEDLCTALSIKVFPQILIYKSGELKWRKAGNDCITKEEIENTINSLI